MQSYRDVPLNALQRIRELSALYAFRRGIQAHEVERLIQDVQEHTKRIECLLGEPLRGKHLLEVGSGQLLKRARIFGVSNHVTCIDLDELPTGSMTGMVRMWQTNGSMRVLKTLVRRLLGMDRRFLKDLYALVPEASNADIHFLRRDATHTGFDKASFDVTVSHSVLEHVADPEALVQEMVRLTRSGGVFSHVVHLYTSDTGAHDPRSYLPQHPDFPYWCHLRPSYKHMSVPNCYVNRWRLADWLEMFERQLPCGQIVKSPGKVAPHVVDALSAIRQAGELADYNDEELIVDALFVSWRKP